MRTTGSKLLRETSILPVRETATVPTMIDAPATGLAVVDDGLVEPNPVAAPELIARVRASLRAMKIQTTRWSRLDRA